MGGCRRRDVDDHPATFGQRVAECKRRQHGAHQIEVDNMTRGFAERGVEQGLVG
jgi:hypothetical protein